MEAYLTIAEVAALLKLRPKTVRNKMARGEFTQGVHYFRRRGLRPLFKSSAVVRWVENSPEQSSSADGIPMARGYVLRTGT